MERLWRRRLFVILFLLVGALFPAVSSRQAKAQFDYQCIGDGLTDYMNDVISAASGGGGSSTLSFIKFTSPAFNMTNDRGSSIAAAMDPGALAQLDAIAGNSYHIGDPTNGISFIEQFLANSGLNSLTNAPTDSPAGVGMPVLITEMGDAQSGNNQDEPINEDQSRMQVLTNAFQNNTVTGGVAGVASINYIGAIYFNPFDGMGNTGWSQFSMSNGFLDGVCAGCSKLGANTGGFYYSDPAFYANTHNRGMGWILEISNADDSTTDGVKAALDLNLTPVIRVGTAVSEGPDAITYGNYLAELDAELLASGYIPGVHEVYAIAGPNEPQSECWATPWCYAAEDCDVEPFEAGNRIIRGKVRSTRQLPNPNGIGKTTSQGVYGAVLTAFTGDLSGRSIDGKCQGTFCGIAGETTTDGAGSFTLTTYFDPASNYEGSQYVAVSCNGIPREVYKIPVAQGNLHDVELTIDADKVCTPNRLPENVAYMILDRHLSCEENLRETALTALREQEPRGNLRKAQLDDTYEGNNPDPSCTPTGTNAAGQPSGCAPVEGGGGSGWIPSEKALDGRADLRAQLENKTCNFMYSLWGLRCKPAPHSPEEALNNLPFASELKDCNKLTAGTQTSSGLNTQTCGGPLLHTTSPGVWKAKYNNTPKSTKIAKNDEGLCGGAEYITLDDIIVPEEWDPDDTGCASFDYMDYKILAFPGEPDKTDLDNSETEVIDDAFDQPDEMFREKIFAGDDKGDQPFRNKSWTVHTAGSPRGEYSRANEECSVSNASDLCYNDAFGGTPGGIMRNPDEIFGIDENLNTNTFAYKASLGRGIYRLGYPLHSSCECNLPGGCEEGSLNNLFDGFGSEGDATGDGHLAVGGYKFCTPAVQQYAPALCELFFGDAIEPFGSILAWAGAVVEAFFGIWLQNITPGGTCNPFEWGSASPGNCENPPPLPDGSGDAQCEITGCWYSDGQDDYIPCPNSSQNCADGVINPGGFTPFCTRRYLNEPSDYQCSGDVEVSDARMQYFSPRTGGIFYSSTADNFTQYFYPVKATINDTTAEASMLKRQVGGLINRAYHYTNEAFWGDNLGHDDRGGSGGAHFHFDLLRMIVSDPKAITDSDLPPPPLDDPTLPGGTGGPGGGDAGFEICDGAPDPAPHNVKPVAALVAEFPAADGEHIERCYNYIINRSQATGNDPAFIMAIWIEETGASYYDVYPTVYDFGCGSTTNNFSVGLECMLGLQGSYTNTGNYIFQCAQIRTPYGTMDVEEFLQPYACGPGSSSNPVNCYANPPEFNFNCTYGAPATYWPDRISEYYARTRADGSPLNMTGGLPSTDWGN